MTQRLIAFQLRLCAWYKRGSSSGNSLIQPYCTKRWKLHQLNYAQMNASKNGSIRLLRKRVCDSFSTDHAIMRNLKKHSSFIRKRSPQGIRSTVRLLTHVHCKPTHFFFHSFIATISYSPQTSFNSGMKDWVDKYHVWGTPTRSYFRPNSQIIQTRAIFTYICVLI